MRERAAWKKTRGLTVTGLIVVLFITVLVAVFGMKLIPAYIEYATAKKAIDAIARDRTAASTPADARRLFDRDRKSTRLNSSHVEISYAVFCLKKKKTWRLETMLMTKLCETRAALKDARRLAGR